MGKGYELAEEARRPDWMAELVANWGKGAFCKISESGKAIYGQRRCKLYRFHCLLPSLLTLDHLL